MREPIADHNAPGRRGPDHRTDDAPDMNQTVREGSNPQ
jgi:hypothetical protein